MNPILEPVPHDEAAEFIKDKPAVTRKVFDKMLPELKARAFTVTGINDADVLRDIRETIAKLPQGGDWYKIREEVADKLQSSNAWFDEEKANKRAELLIRTHGFQAYQATRWQDMRENIDVFPYWRYMSVGDEAVRESHRALDGIVLPADHPFWDDHFPPWDWGCRCQVVPVSQAEFDRIRETDDGKANWEKSILEGERLKKMEREGMLDKGPANQIDIRSPKDTYEADVADGRNPPPPYQWNPGDLRIPMESLEAHYQNDPAAWRVFHDTAKNTRLEDGRTLWEWLGGTPEQPPPAPAFDRNDPVAVRAELARIEPLYAEAVRQRDQALANGSKTDYDNAIKSMNDALENMKKAVYQEPANMQVEFGSKLSKAEKEKVDASMQTVAKLAGTTMEGKKVVVKLCRGRRAYCSGNTVFLSRKNGFPPKTAVHECGHVLEHSDKAIYDKAKAFLDRRTQGESAEPLRTITGITGYKLSEKAKKDKFIHPYMGKLYPAATEVVSMGMEYMAEDPLRLAKDDPDMFDFIFNLLRGK